jgi:hypothetical protein
LEVLLLRHEMFDTNKKNLCVGVQNFEPLRKGFFLLNLTSHVSMVASWLQGEIIGSRQETRNILHSSLRLERTIKKLEAGS